MALLGRIILLASAGFIIFVGIKLSQLSTVPPVPKLENEWWASGKPSEIDTSIRPFKINVSQEVIKDLHRRLDSARTFTPSLEGIQQQYGMNSVLLSEITKFWRTDYDWEKREKWLNQYPQYKTNIQGLDIHFIRVKPSNPEGLKVLPLLLLHGWPGSVREFYGVIPKLTAAQKGYGFVFELIIPSLPGYGFSQGAAKPGLGVPQVAVIFKNLMERLGFDKYYIQGGDWGAMIVTVMSILYPDKIMGMHSNMCNADSPLATLKLVLGSLYPPAIVDKEFEDRVYPLSTVLFQNILMLEMGYLHIQATKPDTVAVGLNDSPVGLAAYIIEKFTTWTNPSWKDRADGGLKEKYSYTDLLDNVMIYWVTNSITTSVRLYAESMSKAMFALGLSNQPVLVPSACARFPHELVYQPDSILSLKYKYLVHTSDLADGGHFAAFEVPDLWANDVWVAIEKMERFRQIHK
ncbi:epoxide hydrolase 1-related [Holotrichia oblita]|uniref:Epoxide hydrolase 1-related n=1 Tax=Holotrichia oblita TaxID=644536 RepID=A0ACB9TYK1_HOLOL|nr:epoxide hydrolase 1-related [Holotrichia oblita]